MEMIIGLSILWLIWWLVKGRKEHETRKSWNSAPYENMQIAKEFGWQISDTGKNLFDTPTIEMTKIEPLPRNTSALWDEDFSTNFVLHIDKNGSMLFAHNSWVEYNELNKDRRVQHEFDIAEIEQKKREILGIAVTKLAEIGAIKCR